MAVSEAKSAFAVDMSANADSQVRKGGSTFATRLQAAAAEKGMSRTDLAAVSGVPKARVSDYWTGPKEPAANYLFALASALDVSAEWLALDVGPRKAAGFLIDAAEADWVRLPRYDLRKLTETSKGLAVENVPFRRDWLSRRLLTSSGLWLTEVPSDYDAIGLLEGDAVICSDIVPGAGPQENWVCIFLGAGGPFVGRYSNRRAGEAIGDTVVTASDIGSGEVHSIARIHARLLAKL